MRDEPASILYLGGDTKVCCKCRRGMYTYWFRNVRLPVCVNVIIYVELGKLNVMLAFAESWQPLSKADNLRDTLTSNNVPQQPRGSCDLSDSGCNRRTCTATLCDTFAEARAPVHEKRPPRSEAQSKDRAPTRPHRHWHRSQFRDGPVSSSSIYHSCTPPFC